MQLKPRAWRYLPMPRELRVILAALAQMKKRVHGHKKPHETRRKKPAAPGAASIAQGGHAKKTSTEPPRLTCAALAGLRDKSNPLSSTVFFIGPCTIAGPAVHHVGNRQVRYPAHNRARSDGSLESNSKRFRLPCPQSFPSTDYIYHVRDVRHTSGEDGIRTHGAVLPAHRFSNSGTRKSLETYVTVFSNH